MNKIKFIIRNKQGKLLIKNLDPDIEVSQLHDAFANFGEVITYEIPADIQIITRPDGKKEKKLSQEDMDMSNFVIQKTPNRQ